MRSAAWVEKALQAALLCGLVAAIACWPFFGQKFAVALFCGAMWAALNFSLLALLLLAVSGRIKLPRMFIFLLVCAKIPASYLILFWISTREYLSPAGIVAGLSIPLAAILFYGLRAGFRNHEEGTV